MDAPGKLAFAAFSRRIYDGKHLSAPGTRTSRCDRIRIDIENEGARARVPARRGRRAPRRVAHRGRARAGCARAPCVTAAITGRGELAEQRHARGPAAGRDVPHPGPNAAFTGVGSPCRLPRVDISPFRKSTAGARPRSMTPASSCSYAGSAGPPRRSARAWPEGQGSPAARRSSSVSAIQSRSRVPLTFSRATLSRRATCTTSVMISSARRRHEGSAAARRGGRPRACRGS